MSGDFIFVRWRCWPGGAGCRIDVSSARRSSSRVSWPPLLKRPRWTGIHFSRRAIRDFFVPITYGLPGILSKMTSFGNTMTSYRNSQMIMTAFIFSNGGHHFHAGLALLTCRCLSSWVLDINPACRFDGEYSTTWRRYAHVRRRYRARRPQINDGRALTLTTLYYSVDMLAAPAAKMKWRCRLML